MVSSDLLGQNIILYDLLIILVCMAHFKRIYNIGAEFHDKH